MSDLLAELLASAAEASAARKVKASKSKGTGIAAASAELQAARENLYLPHRLVAVFHRTTCAHCGSVHEVFEGLFEERKHIRVSDLHMVRQPFIPLETNLPRVRKYLPAASPYCQDCSGLHLYKEEE